MAADSHRRICDGAIEIDRNHAIASAIVFLFPGRRWPYGRQYLLFDSPGFGHNLCAVVIRSVILSITLGIVSSTLIIHDMNVTLQAAQAVLGVVFTPVLCRWGVEYLICT